MKRYGRLKKTLLMAAAAVLLLTAAVFLYEMHLVHSTRLIPTIIGF